MTNAPLQPRPMKTPARSSARNDLDRIEAAGTPWWANAPHVAKTGFSVAVAPLKFVESVGNLVVTYSFVAMIGIIALCYLKVIPDTTVAAVLNEVGTRILGILETSGLF